MHKHSSDWLQPHTEQEEMLQLQSGTSDYQLSFSSLTFCSKTAAGGSPGLNFYLAHTV